MQIAVYTIAKNEAWCLPRWAASCAEADLRVIVDTGSTDETIGVVRDLGLTVHAIHVRPWRFDDARNAALALLPDGVDACVSLDADMVLLPGWREALERSWRPETNLGFARIVMNRLPDGEPGSQFRAIRVHARFGVRWIYPIHEVITTSLTEPRVVTLEGLDIEHRPLPGREPDRDTLGLLRLARSEMPDEPRHAHYLGRELMWHGQWEDAIRELRAHVEMPESRWHEERSASMRYLARCYAHLGDRNNRIHWARRCVAECAYLRENWLELASVCREMGFWAEAYAALLTVVQIQAPAYITEEVAWGDLPAQWFAEAASKIGLPQAGR
jgi:glycosyltransferase involved in cell wall biosynthesis